MRNARNGMSNVAVFTNALSTAASASGLATAKGATATDLCVQVRYVCYMPLALLANLPTTSQTFPKIRCEAQPVQPEPAKRSSFCRSFNALLDCSI